MFRSSRNHQNKEKPRKNLPRLKDAGKAEESHVWFELSGLAVGGQFGQSTLHKVLLFLMLLASLSLGAAAFFFLYWDAKKPTWQDLRVIEDVSAPGKPAKE